MTNSFTEMQNSLDQFAVNNVRDFSDIEALDNCGSSQKRPRIDLESQQYGPLARDEPLTAVPEREIDKLISQPSPIVEAETLSHSNSHDIPVPVLSGITNDLKLEQQKTPAINEQLANIVQSSMREKLDDEVLAETKTRYLISENCDSLTSTKVNHIMWDQLKPETRSLV